MEINLIYIDDRLDNELSNYLEVNLPSDLTALGCSDVVIAHRDVEYKPADGFAALLQNPNVAQANVAIIDSKLFENESLDETMLTGEEFLIILKKYYPFIESIVISQVQSRLIEEPNILPKWSSINDNGIGADEFYQKQLAPRIATSIKNIRAYRSASRKLNQNVVDGVTLEQVQNAIEGLQEYDGLTSSDIDRAVEHFEEIKKLVMSEDA